MRSSGCHLNLGLYSQNGYERGSLSYSVWPASGGVPSVEFSPGLLMGPPLDWAATCVGIGGEIYSNFRESRVNVTGPYSSPPLDQNCVKHQHERGVTSLVKLTFIMAPNFPSVG
jgi:hypothetical protein